MFLNNSFNILPWYDSLEKQSSKKWYTFGQSWPLLCPKGTILPFQFVCEALEVTSNIQAVNVNTNEITDLGVAPSVIQGSQPNSTYYIVKLASVAVPALSVGTYYLRFKTSLGYLYSEEIAVIDDSNECIKVQYWNEDTLNFASGEINFADDFKFEFYIRSTIGKPEYEFEEELTKRLGYKFIESQTSNKVYKFAFVAPEYICDAMRLIRLCDYVKLTTKFDSYNALSFAYEPKWQDQGDLAAVDVEFDTDCIIQKLESFNRRIKESFYNALLADIDEPVLFSTDTVAQYYTEFTTTSFINGKLIRQLESISPNELQSNFVDLVLPIDNMADDKNTAKKVALPDLMSLVNSSDISKLFKGHFDADGNLQWIEALSHIGVNGGVTMFIDNGTMSLPQLYSGLPIDGKTLIRDENGVLMINPDIDLGGASTWDELIGKPSWITTNKPKWSYDEDIIGKPDLSVYAKSTEVEELLKKYVTLDTDETINGLKNFAKGIQIDGLGITKSQDDVMYIDANLVVRGGITMFGTNSVDVPTIMDAIATDGTNLKVVNGVLTFVGSIDGGEAGSVAWKNVEGKPSWIGSSKPSYSYSEISGTPTLLSSFTDDVVSGKYLKLSGGTLENTKADALSLKRQNSSAGAYLSFKNSTNGWLGGIGIGGSSTSFGIQPFVKLQSGTYQIYHNGNLTPTEILTQLKTVDGSGSGLDADLLDGTHKSDLLTAASSSSDTNLSITVGGTTKNITDLYAYKATQLETARKIWGQSFNGTKNISGALSGATTGSFSSNVTIGGTLGVTGDTTLASKLTLNGIPIYKSQDDVLYIDGNLAVRGGITMYATDAIDVPSIIDALPIASTSANGIASFNPNDFSVVDGYVSFIGSTGGGLTEVYWDDVRGRPTLLSSFINDKGFASSLGELANVGSWADSAPTQGRLLYQAAGSSVWSYKNVSEFISETGAYLSLSGGTLNGNLSLGGNKINNVQTLQFASGVRGAANSGCSILGAFDAPYSATIQLGGYGTTPPSNVTSSYYSFKIVDNAWTSELFMVNNDGKNVFGCKSAINDNSHVRGVNIAGQLKFTSTTPTIPHPMIFGDGSYLTIGYGNVTNYGIVIASGEVRPNAKDVFNLGIKSYRWKSICAIDAFLGGYAQFDDMTGAGGMNTGAARIGTFDHTEGGLVIQLGKSTTADNTSSGKQKFEVINPAWNKALLALDRAGNLGVTGGITMYSDKRKKTILNHVELSLKQIADAPLIEHYYNSDAMRTTHVGSIAQYWAGLNDWFCKLDSEGFYTMEIQNAALASAISIARELVKYESKTDKEIRMLKYEVKRLKKEIKILKSA